MNDEGLTETIVLEREVEVGRYHVRLEERVGSVCWSCLRRGVKDIRGIRGDLGGVRRADERRRDGGIARLMEITYTEEGKGNARSCWLVTFK